MLNIDKSKDVVDQDSKYGKFIKYLKGKYKTNEIYSIDITTKEFNTNISRDISNPFYIDSVPYYLNRKGDRSLNNVNYNTMSDSYNNDKVLAYFNTKFPDISFKQIQSRLNDKYLVKDNEGNTYLLDDNGIIDLTTFTLDKNDLGSYNSQFIRAFFNAKK